MPTPRQPLPTFTRATFRRIRSTRHRSVLVKLGRQPNKPAYTNANRALTRARYRRLK